MRRVNILLGECKQRLADNIIRLHVLANSDSPEDQQLKRDVRDVVINFMKDKLKNVKDVEPQKE